MMATLNSSYRQKARMLRSNLGRPENSCLRSRVLSRKLSPSELCHMDSYSLAPEATQRWREAVSRESLHGAWDREGPLPKAPYEGLDSTCSSYRNAGAPPPLPRRRGGECDEDSHGELDTEWRT
mmetsp:Transcript_115721/g.327251  ORF Transcript_115721/g.327251 Transcript_115721/m.327251 type:complete len:124 (+) Transcript_115721:208-579(+)